MRALHGGDVPVGDRLLEARAKPLEVCRITNIREVTGVLEPVAEQGRVLVVTRPARAVSVHERAGRPG